MPRKALVTDLARLELAMTEVFHAPQAQPLTAGQLADVPPELWPNARLRPIPAFAVLALHHDANAIVTAVRQELPMPPLRRHESFVAVWRRDHIVWRQDLDAPRYALLAALADGRTVGRALAAAAKCWFDDPAQLPQQVFTWFARWTAEGFFAAVELPPAAKRPARSAPARSPSRTPPSRARPSQARRPGLRGRGVSRVSRRRGARRERADGRGVGQLVGRAARLQAGGGGQRLHHQRRAPAFALRRVGGEPAQQLVEVAAERGDDRAVAEAQQHRGGHEPAAGVGGEQLLPVA